MSNTDNTLSDINRYEITPDKPTKTTNNQYTLLSDPDNIEDMHIQQKTPTLAALLRAADSLFSDFNSHEFLLTIPSPPPSLCTGNSCPIQQQPQIERSKQSVTQEDPLIL